MRRAGKGNGMQGATVQESRQGGSERARKGRAGERSASQKLGKEHKAIQGQDRDKPRNKNIQQLKQYLDELDRQRELLHGGGEVLETFEAHRKRSQERFVRLAPAL